MSDERIGSEVAAYRIVSELGRGGMGTVYVAEQSAPRRKVVLKLPRPEGGPVASVAVDQDSGAVWVLLADVDRPPRLLDPPSRRRRPSERR